MGIGPTPKAGRWHSSAVLHRAAQFFLLLYYWAMDHPSKGMPDPAQRGGPLKRDTHPTKPRTGGDKPQREELSERIQVVRQRMLEAAIAFCDGLISAGQLRALRELLRELELRQAESQGKHAPPLAEERPAPAAVSDPEVVNLPPLRGGELAMEVSSPEDELTALIAQLEQKMQRLEQDYQQGRINAAQYRAIKKHYQEQREVAVKLRQTHPSSDRWKVVLEEGKTTFLLQLNEAAVRYVAFYDLKSRQRIFEQGTPTAEVQMAVPLIASWGSSLQARRILATHADDGGTMLLIPGRYSAALICFTHDPPGWQVRALREVHRNFEAANRAALEQGKLDMLVLPDMNRFIKDGAQPPG